MQCLQVRVHIKLLLGGRTTLLVLDGGKERAEAVNLQLLLRKFFKTFGFIRINPYLCIIIN